MHSNILLFIKNISAITISHILVNSLCGIVFYLQLCVLVVNAFTVFFTSVFMFNHSTDSYTSSFIFSIHIWLLCSCHSICFSNWDGIVILLSFSSMPSHIAISFFIGKNCLTPWPTSSFLHVQHCIIYVFSSWRGASSCVSVCMSCIDVYTGMFTDVLMDSIHGSLSLSIYFFSNTFVL